MRQYHTARFHFTDRNRLRDALDEFDIVLLDALRLHPL